MRLSRGRRALMAATAIAAFCAFQAASAGAAAPAISGTSFSSPTTDLVVLQASINPESKATLYRFEYGPADCASNPCTKVPVPEGSLPSGTAPVPVSFDLGGLQPGEVLHFRVVAKNAEGETKGPDRAFAPYIPSPAFGPCPNDFLRVSNPSQASLEYSAASLPDCRAFEQASPVDKNGGDATGISRLTKASVGGDAVSFLSTAGMPGGVGAQDIPSFLATRGAGGWLTQGMLPPAVNGENARVLGWTPDFSAVFTEATLRSEPTATTLLVTPGTGGPPTTVVDYTPGLEPDFAGTTQDGSLLFESVAKLTPEANAGESNVYLWESTGGQVSLISVMNDESAPKDGAFAGPFDWIHGTNSATLTRGGSAAGYYTAQQNAISTDGKAAFFTEGGSGQLYLRRNPGEGQSPLSGDECTDGAKACTVRVSKSHKTTGLEPGGSERGGPRPAAFQQASPDGSSVLFTSSEELTDDANTGPEPTDLPPEPTVGRSNLTGGEITSFIPARANALSLDATYLYWLDSEAGAIGRVELDGSNRDPAFITGLPSGVEDLEADASFLYWVDPQAGTVGRTEVDGTGALELDFIEGATEPRGVAVDATYLYWTNAGGSDPEDPRTIGRAELDGSGADQDFIGLETFTGGALAPERITVGEGHIYLTTENGVGIYRFTLAGAQDDSFLGSELEKKRDITVENGFVYWSAEGTKIEGFPGQYDSAIYRSDLDLNLIIGFPGNRIVYGPEVEEARSLAVNGTNIYWANNPPLAIKPGNDLYLFEDDGEDGELIDLTPDNSSTNGAEVRGVLGASEDLSHVYFAANGVLAGGASLGDCGGGPVLGAGNCNLYHWHEGTTEFIAELETGGAGGETDAANWMAAVSPRDTFPDERQQKTARVSPDGQTLLFRSQRQLGEYPSEGIAQFYRYRVGEGLACVSCNPTLAPPLPTGGVALGSIAPAQTLPKPPASFMSNVLSTDGNRVFFETTEPLVVADTNGEGGCPGSRFGPLCFDVYEWEAAGTGSCKVTEAVAGGGCLYLLSTGKSEEPSLLADASADGESVFIFSRARLVGQDQDELLDVYGLPVGGGLTAQNPPPPNPCPSVESCHGPVPAPPGVQSPSTPSFVGPGDQKVKRKAAKKRKHKGQKKGKGKRRQKQRRAQAERGAGR